MKKSHLVKRGLQDLTQPSSQPDKVGWIRRFSGKGIFREIWRNRFVMLKGDHLYIFEKEMKNDGKTHEVFDLAQYERSEELRKVKSHSKKNHSKFTLLRSQHPGNKVMTEEESLLAHPTRDRAKIPLGRRLPTRGHLMAVASASSDGMLTLDLVNEEDSGLLGDDQDECLKDHHVSLDKLAPSRRRAGIDASRPSVSVTDGKVKTSSLPRKSEFSWSCENHPYTPQNEKKFAQGRNRCASMDDTLSRGERKPNKKNGFQATLAQSPTGHLQDLISQRLLRTQELLAEIQELEPHRGRMGSYNYLRDIDSPRLRHLKGSDSPHSKGSSSHNSPHSKGTDSPSVRAKDSPGSKGKGSAHVKDSPRFKSPKSPHSKSALRSKSIDSPDSKESSSPHWKRIDLTDNKGSESPLSTGSNSPKIKSTDPAFFRISYSPHFRKGTDSPLSEDLDWDSRRAAAERLLQEAISSWREAREVLAEVKELQARQKRAEHRKTGTPTTPSQNRKQKSP
uniref:Pleckstrin homology domain containing, family O member 1a n=1 Tax=Cyprinus carpio TaxID=7962 RepID=A0A8C2IU16_CYPCA